MPCWMLWRPWLSKVSINLTYNSFAIVNTHKKILNKLFLFLLSSGRPACFYGVCKNPCDGSCGKNFFYIWTLLTSFSFVIKSCKSCYKTIQHLQLLCISQVLAHAPFLEMFLTLHFWNCFDSNRYTFVSIFKTGVNADCNLRGLTPICSCPRDMTGDPFVSCRPFTPGKLFGIFV